MINESQTATLQQFFQGNALKELGLSEKAIHHYQQGLALYPDNAELWYNLGTDLLTVPRLPEAVQALQQAISLKPDLAEAYTNLGFALAGQGLSTDAIHCYQQGLSICPDNVQLWFNLGTAFIELQRLPDGAAALQQAIALKPDFAAAYTNLGHALLNLQRLSEAVEVFQQVIALKPDFAAAYSNLGNALQAQGKAEDAIKAYNRAIALNPTEPDVYINRSMATLLSGDLARGFAEYERRTKSKRYRFYHEWSSDLPHWHGESFSGKRLLVYAEQGLGDIIQFSRYLPLVKARGGTVQFSVPQPLLRLFAHLSGVDELVEHTADAIARIQFDLVVPLLSLPYIFGTTLPTVPADTPYLFTAKHCIAAWRGKVKGPGATFRVGLVWSGNPDNTNKYIRNCSLQAMSPLCGIPGVIFYSLQKGKAASQAGTPPPGMQFIDLTEEITDFADTATLIMNLDLVITVDTAVAHLAGALGKPVWTLLPAAGEWRWLLSRNDTPWYPAMRLFRQSAPGDWSSVMTAVAYELRMLASAKV